MKFNKDLAESIGGNFLKLKDKESVYGMFRGDPREYNSLFVDGKGAEVPPGTPGSKFRFRINFLLKVGDEYQMKIIENGATFYNQMADLNDEYPLETTVVKITRKGSGRDDTSYSILPILNATVSAETKAKLDAIPMFPLTPTMETPKTPDADGIPF